ncbi:MAG TPA: cation diffusion facilitator family transporter [Candidatus Kapabacteria bacterium]|jgi:cation diffusion facilitator family transporter|nr:cation diffusion facilitator family transporter [Candidatus Kapabacteria bacterium]
MQSSNNNRNSAKAGERAAQAVVDQSVRRRAALISVVVGLAMFAGKTGGYFITGSAAILSDALESVVHVIATSMALYSIILAARPADPRHPYGYGKVEYFSAGVEGILIVIAAIAICFEATRDIIRGPELRSIDIGVWVVGTAGAINLALGFFLIRTGKRTRSLALVADGKHVLTDSYTSIGVLIGLLLVQATDIVLLDPLFAIAVAINILWTGYGLVSESVRGLMNVTDKDTLDRALAALNRIRTPEMLDIHRLRAWRAGEWRFIDFHLTLPNHYTLEHAHAVHHQVYDAICDEFHGQAEVMIHLDPAIDGACANCGRVDCDDPSCIEELARGFTLERAVAEPRRPADADPHFHDAPNQQRER